MVELLILEVGVADGVCTCTSGASHLHLTTEAKVREEAVVDALRALGEPNKAVDPEWADAKADARFPVQCEEIFDAGPGQARCIRRFGHSDNHTFIHE